MDINSTDSGTFRHPDLDDILDSYEQLKNSEGIGKLTVQQLNEWDVALDLTPLDLYRMYSVIADDLVLGKITELSKEVREFIVNRREHLREVIRGHVTYDYLTGVLKRGPFEQEGKLLLQSADRGKYKLQDQTIGVAVVDLNDFKKINDQIGHHKGDEVLRYSGESLKKFTRDVDRVGRTGGDEFTILFDRYNRTAPHEKIMTRLIGNVNAYLAGNSGVDVTVSLGFALHDVENLRSLSETTQRADLAMYRGKRSPTDIDGRKYHFHGDYS